MPVISFDAPSAVFITSSSVQLPRSARLTNELIRLDVIRLRLVPDRPLSAARCPAARRWVPVCNLAL